MEINKKQIKIILISGKARAGKDTSASYFNEYFKNKGLKTIVLQFSTSIKDYAKNITGWDGKDETKPREFLQILGTSIIREKIDDEFFIKRMIQDIKVYSYFYDIIIISDKRIIKEIELIKDNFKDVIAINVVRPNYENNLSSKQMQHITEISLDSYDKFDLEISNDKGLEELRSSVYNIAEKIVN